jgi:hypothetical protein
MCDQDVILTKQDAARKVVEECFWGDYTFDADDILRLILENSAYNDSFLIRRIVDNAVWPSRLLRVLFPHDRVIQVLEKPAGSYKSAYHERRHRIVRANLTGDYSLVPERRWPSPPGR